MYSSTLQIAVSDLISIRQIIQMLPLLFTPKLITTILITIDSLSLYCPVFSRFKTLLLVLSLMLRSPVISLPSYALSTVSESLKASNTNSSRSPTKFSQPPPYLLNSSVFNILVVLAFYLLLLLLGHQHHPL